MRNLFSGIALIVCSFWACTARLPAPVYAVKMDAAEYNRVGKATCTTLFGLFTFGDCSVNSAMIDGNVHRIHHIDRELENYVVFRRMTTVVYGEERKKSQEELRRESKKREEIRELHVGSVYKILDEHGRETHGLVEQLSKSVAIVIDQTGNRRVVKLESIVDVRPSEFGE